MQESYLASNFGKKEEKLHSTFRIQRDDAKNYFIDPRYTKLKKAKFSMPDAIGLLLPFEIIIE